MRLAGLQTLQGGSNNNKKGISIVRRLITKSLELLSFVIIAIIVLGAAIGGASTGGFFGFIGGLIGGAVMSIVIFGALFVLMDTADNTKRIVELMEQQQQDS
jgi:uncharacterized membrane protein